MTAEELNAQANGLDYQAQARQGEALQLLALVQQLQNFVIFTALAAQLPPEAREVAASKLDRLAIMLRNPQ